MATHKKENLTDQQIRQKLLHQGVKRLSDAELLSIILRSGEQGRTALEMAERLLSEFGGNLLALSRCELSRLRSIENLGITRAALTLTALELGRRLRAEETFTKEVIDSDRDVIELFAPLLSTLPHEEFWLLCLNASNRIIDRVRISQGGVAGTVVDCKLILKRAIDHLAAGVILVHNHPSGNATPSTEDRTITRQLHQGAALLDISLLDHLIISSGGHYSFREHGFFDLQKGEEEEGTVLSYKKEPKNF